MIVNGRASPRLRLLVPHPFVMPECVNAFLRLFGIEPTTRQHHADGINSVRHRVLLHDLGRADAEAAQRLKTAFSAAEFSGLHVVGQDVTRIYIRTLPEEPDVVIEAGAAVLDVVYQPPLAAAADLQEPNGRAVVDP